MQGLRRIPLSSPRNLLRSSGSTTRILPPAPTFPKANVSVSAIRPASNKMEKILTANAPAPIGPYSQAIRTGNTLYVSGQVPANADGSLVEGSIAEKTAAVMKNLKAILTEAGGNLSNIVKATVFLDDMGNFAEVNQEYQKWITHAPARSCIAVKQLPKSVPIEIEVIAIL